MCGIITILHELSYLQLEVVEVVEVVLPHHAGTPELGVFATSRDVVRYRVDDAAGATASRSYQQSTQSTTTSE